MTTKTYSIKIEDKIKGYERELFYATIAQAAIRIEELHQWARDNGYSPADYTLTLSKI